MSELASESEPPRLCEASGRAQRGRAISTLTEFTEVPVVDVAGLLGDDPRQQRRVARELGQAAREIGFLQVTGTGIDPALFADLLRVTKAFFDLPHEVKMRTYIGRSRNHRGYVPVGEEVFSGGSVDLKEADVFDAYVTKPPSQLRLIHYPHDCDVG